MPKYLFEASYSADGVRGLLEDGGSKRAQVVADLIQAAGGSLEAFYYAFGDCDIYVIADLPDEEAAISLSLAVTASGAGSVKTTVLIDPATVDAAVQKSVSYAPPGT